MVGAGWTSGKNGSAVFLDGDRRPRRPAALGTFYRTAFTFEAWVLKRGTRKDVTVLGSWDSGGPMIWVDNVNGRYMLTLGADSTNYLDSGRTPAVGPGSTSPARGTAPLRGSTSTGSRSRTAPSQATSERRTCGESGPSAESRSASSTGSSTTCGSTTAPCRPPRSWATCRRASGRRMHAADDPDRPRARLPDGNVARPLVVGVDRQPRRGRLQRLPRRDARRLPDRRRSVTVERPDVRHHVRDRRRGVRRGWQHVSAVDRHRLDRRLRLDASARGARLPDRRLLRRRGGDRVGNRVRRRPARQRAVPRSTASISAPRTRSPPYTTSWNTRLSVSGPHVVTAVARDAAGNTATATANVTVDNSGAPGPGLVAGYGFDEGSGTAAGDGSGDAHTGIARRRRGLGHGRARHRRLAGRQRRACRPAGARHLLPDALHASRRGCSRAARRRTSPSSAHGTAAGRWSGSTTSTGTTC